MLDELAGRLVVQTCIDSGGQERLLVSQIPEQQVIA